MAPFSTPTPEQLEELRVACEADSPVVDTLKREVDITLDFRSDNAPSTASAG